MRGPAGPAGAREQRRAREQSAARRQGMPAPPGPAPLFYDQILAAAARVERELAADEGSAEGDGDGDDQLCTSTGCMYVWSWSPEE